MTDIAIPSPIHTADQLDNTPGAPPNRAPIPVFDHQFHPDTPGPLTHLIWALHCRLVALEIELGLRKKPEPPVVEKPVAATVEVVTIPESPPPATVS